MRNRFDFQIFKNAGVIWYNSTFIAGMSIFSFEFCRRLNGHIPVFLSKCSGKISEYSLGIFFIHFIVLKLFTKYVNLDFLSVPVRILILLIFVFIVSYLITYLLCKNRRIGKILCYYKG